MNMGDTNYYHDRWLDFHFRSCAQTIGIANTNPDHHDTDIMTATHGLLQIPSNSELSNNTYLVASFCQP